MTKTHGEIDGDLFVDCTGFRLLILGEHLKVPFIPKNDVLFIDQALAVQVPYSDGAPIQSQTNSTGQSAGWTWDIGLSSRRGVGHVYSSAHTTEIEAADALRTYLKLDLASFEALNPRKLKIQSGYRARFWKNNCVAVGLSAGFLEPLEASAIAIIEKSAKAIAAQLPSTRATMDVIAQRFNATLLYDWERTIDFLKLHYVLSKRDEPFWKDNRATSTMSEKLRQDLELWAYEPPWISDFPHQGEIFGSASYQYVLYGMGFKSKISALGHLVLLRCYSVQFDGKSC